MCRSVPCHHGEFHRKSDFARCFTFRFLPQDNIKRRWKQEEFRGSLIHRLRSLAFLPATVGHPDYRGIRAF
jgi:hypothetical protein